MALQLLLQRHAMSSQDDPAFDDHSRPLNQQGWQAAKKMADLLLEKDLKPDLILCSSAERTRRTADPILNHWPRVMILYESALYLASVERVCRVLRQAQSPNRILIIGHNPTIEDMARNIIDPASDNHASSLSTLRIGYPTGALTVFTLSCPSWKKFTLPCGQLTAFYRPRNLSN